jgi:N-methylhydantoinase B
MASTDHLRSGAGEDADVQWDGITNSYRPPYDWRDHVAPELRFHIEVDDDLDPVTFEVIRNRLWSINIAHGEQVTRVSGSPVFASLDFNMSILTEDGEIVQNAPFIQWMAAGAPFGVRYVMQHLSNEVGIHPGDVFVVNDPWIAAIHEMDVLFVRPLFVGGELFCWTANAGHQYDLGGIQPGGWPQDAVDVHSDPTIFTPFKIVTAGRLNPELERMYVRNSREPEMLALDLRAQISGVTFAGDQIAALVERFGAATVKGAMRRIIDNAQESMRRKLDRLPDGTWSEVKYFDHKLPGDRNTYRMQINITKTGDRLRVDNTGTEPQPDVGPLGITALAMAGSTTGMLAVMVVYEQLFSVGGAERQIDWDIQPGLATSIQHPAAVGAGVLNTIAHAGAVQACLSRMLSCDPQLAQDAVAPSAEYAAVVVTGRDEQGEGYGQAILDHFAMGSGARSFKDGIGAAGPPWSPLTFLLNVEAVEQWYPMIYLYRRELADSGGAGRWRGGTGFAYAWAPYRAETMDIMTFSAGMAISAYSAAGIAGGYPSPAARVVLANDTDIKDWFARREVPNRLEDFAFGDRTYLAGKNNPLPVGPNDIVEATIMGGGGFGDPLDREPYRVAADVTAGAVSVSGASGAYGVIVDEHGKLDAAATDERRRELRAARSDWPEVPRTSQGATHTPPSGEPTRHVHPAIIARDESEQRVLACATCDATLCDYGEDFKRHVLRDIAPVSEVPGGSGVDPSLFLDVEVQFRRFCCPECHTLLTTEVRRGDEDVTPDMVLHPGTTS